MFSRQVKKGYKAKGSSAEEEARPPLSEQTPTELTKNVQKDITYETKNIFKFQPSVAGSFVVVILFLCFSTLAFMRIEDMSRRDAFYFCCTLLTPSRARPSRWCTSSSASRSSRRALARSSARAHIWRPPAHRGCPRFNGSSGALPWPCCS